MAFTGQAAAASCTASTQQSPSPTTVERSPSISKTCGQILAHNPHPIHSSVTFTFIFLLLLPLAVLLTLYTCLNKINTFFQNGTKKCGYNTKNDNFFENCNRLRCKLHASTFFEIHRPKATLPTVQVFSCCFLCKAKLNLFTPTDAKTRFTHCYRLFSARISVTLVVFCQTLPLMRPQPLFLRR